MHMTVNIECSHCRSSLDIGDFAINKSDLHAAVVVDNFGTKIRDS